MGLKVQALFNNLKNLDNPRFCFKITAPLFTGVLFSVSIETKELNYLENNK